MHNKTCAVELCGAALLCVAYLQYCGRLVPKFSFLKYFTMLLKLLQINWMHKIDTQCV